MLKQVGNKKKKNSRNRNRSLTVSLAPTMPETSSRFTGAESSRAGVPPQSTMSRPIPHRASAFSGYVPPGAVGENSLDSEAWHACAGPLVCLPRVGDRVVYFPQGHIEQVLASTNQNAADLQIPQYNLPSQIFCRVLNLSLGAYRETDEVYAQMTLVPENEQADHSPEFDEPAAPSRPKLSMFCKILTSSDTSTHGGFSVPRRAAEECFPELDYQQTPPAQELIAKDLHGVEWKFRHIYRGQPRRHLLTTGWSVFVSQKKLVAGDAVLFVRGDNGELRIGIRRAVRPQNSVTSSSLLSSHSMQIGVLAAAAHAVGTRTMFTVFYNPRASPAEFVVPYHKYLKAFKLNISVGMRFKMRFESEDSSERRYMGTIIGINDLDLTRWPNSKWRLLKVGWDEHAASERQERVSPWEIEPFIAPNVTPSNGTATKRFRPTMLTEIGARSSYSATCHLQQVLQDLRKPTDEIDYLLKPSKWPTEMPKLTPGENYGSVHSFGGSPRCREYMLPALSPKFALEQQQQRLMDMQQQLLRRSIEQFKKQEKQPGGFGAQQVLDFNKPPVSPGCLKSVPNGNSDSFLKLLTSSGQLTACPDESSNTTGGKLTTDEPVSKTTEDQKSVERDCKLFGFSLKASSPQEASSKPAAILSKESEGFMLKSFTSQSWGQTTPPNRTCTKVHKQGSVSRAVDLSKFQGYSELLDEIKSLFGIEEKLNTSDTGWQAVFTDEEGDLLLIGDDIWEEFCSTVRSIRILSPAEVQKMTTLQTTRNNATPADERLSKDVSRLSDQQDSSSAPPTPTSRDVDKKL